MNKRILGGLAVAAIFAGGLALTSGTASAVVQDEGGPKVCYDSVERPTYGDVIGKETQTRTRTWVQTVPAGPGTWQNFSPNNQQETFEGLPSWPSDERGTWQHSNKDIPGGHAGPDGVYQNGNGNGSWFYRVAGTPGVDGYWTAWSEYGPWTDWPEAGPLNDDGRARGPLPHGSGDDWERQYRYVVVGQYQTGTETVEEEVTCPIPASTLGLTYNQDCAPDATNTWRVRPTGVNQPVKWELFQDGVSIGSGVTNPGDGETKVEVDRKQPSTAILKWDSDGNGSLDKETVKASGPDLTVSSNPEKCSPAQPDDKVMESEWKNGEFDCGDTTVKQTRTVTTTPYIWDAETRSWVLDPNGATKSKETRTRDLTKNEQFPCPTTPPTPETPTPTPPVVNQLPPTQVPPVVVPPAQAPPVVVSPAQAPPVVVGQLPPAQAPAVSPTAPAAGLPATGSNGTGVTALIALLLTSLGGAALFAGRRRNVTT